MPVQCKGGEGVGVAQRVTPTRCNRYPIPYPPIGPGGYPGLLFCFENKPARVTWGYSPYSGIPPAARAAAPTAAPTAERPNWMENGFASERQTGEKTEIWTGWDGNALVSEAGVLTPSFSNLCMQPNYWTMGTGATG